MNDYVRLPKVKKYMALCGAPVSVLSSRNNDFSFKNILNEKFNINSEIQKSYYDCLVSNEYDIGKPMVVSIGGESLISSQKVAVSIVESYINNSTNPFPYFKHPSIAYTDFDEFNNYVPTAGVVMFSIDKNPEQRRLQILKDYIQLYRSSTIILCVETNDITEFMTENMGYVGDIVLQTGRVQKVRTKI